MVSSKSAHMSHVQKNTSHATMDTLQPLGGYTEKGDTALIDKLSNEHHCLHPKNVASERGRVDGPSWPMRLASQDSRAMTKQLPIAIA